METSELKEKLQKLVEATEQAGALICDMINAQLKENYAKVTASKSETEIMELIKQCNELLKCKVAYLRKVQEPIKAMYAGMQKEG